MDAILMPELPLLFWSYIKTVQFWQIRTVSRLLLKSLYSLHHQCASVNLGDVKDVEIASAPHLHVRPPHPSEFLDVAYVSLLRQRQSTGDNRTSSA